MLLHNISDTLMDLLQTQAAVLWRTTSLTTCTHKTITASNITPPFNLERYTQDGATTIDWNRHQGYHDGHGHQEIEGDREEKLMGDTYIVRIL